MLISFSWIAVLIFLLQSVETATRSSKRTPRPPGRTPGTTRSPGRTPRPPANNANFGLVDSKCTPQKACNRTSPYRTSTGRCNNMIQPNKANVFGPLLRDMRANAYDDGRDSPRMRSVTGVPLPSPRKVSNKVHSTLTKTNHTTYSHMLMQFLQFVTHDIVFTQGSINANGKPLVCDKCNSNPNAPNCSPIPVPTDDPNFQKKKCLPFTRSFNGNLSTRQPRNQINQNTHYLDGSVIYGSNDCIAKELRTMRGGLMRTMAGLNGVEILPTGDQEKNCKSKNLGCFDAGDVRSNLHPGLQTLHTVFLREHNRIARRLAQLRPDLSDEMLYQESRRIVIAQLQHITYAEALPRVLGSANMAEYDLTPAKDGFYNGYSGRCDASIRQGFAVAAFRYGHTTVQSEWARMNAQLVTMAPSMKLGDNFLFTNVIFDRAGGGVDSLTRGLLRQPQMPNGRFASAAVRNLIFSDPNKTGSGQDLIAINIMRGRDHGIPDYNTYRALVGLPKATNFNGLATEMDRQTIQALRSVYANVNDIDLFTGIVSERPTNGAQMGPTGQKLIGDQFKNLKMCDRFFYENGAQAVRFTRRQLNELRRVTLSQLVCNNVPGMTRAPEQAFEFNSRRLPCKPPLNVNLFV